MESKRAFKFGHRRVPRKISGFTRMISLTGSIGPVAYAKKLGLESFARERAYLPASLVEHFNPASPRLVSHITRRQKSARQQRITRHRLQPRFALRRTPAPQCFRGRVIPQRATRSLLQRFQIASVAAIDAIEVP